MGLAAGRPIAARSGPDLWRSRPAARPDGATPVGGRDRAGRGRQIELRAVSGPRQREMGCTPIVATHDRRFIRPGDRIIAIQDGRIANSA